MLDNFHRNNFFVRINIFFSLEICDFSQICVFKKKNKTNKSKKCTWNYLNSYNN